ncbi:sugar phosphate isomerase/epimerase family protein [Glaciecola sp. 1036]|uniref:sugar phosphate isomerase/epimerase family protein n=1 Tax=Alteromonadaceae TaxID=72275 RepID=UPI003D015BA9
MSFKFSLKTLLLGCMFSLSLASFAHEMGLQVYTVRHQFEDDGVDKTFALIKQWDLKLLEGAGNLYGLTIHEYKNALIKHDLQVVSVDTNYEEVEKSPLSIAYKADFYGAKFATFYWIPHEGAFSIEHAKKAVEVLNRSGKILKEHGITLQYHPHGYELIEYEEGTLLDYMVQNVTEAQFQMDVFWIKNGGGDPVAYLKKYPGRWTSLHVKDRVHGTQNNATGSQAKDTNVVLGTGDVGIEAIVKEAKSQGIRYFFIEDESSRVEKQMPQSIEYLKKLGVH